MNEVREAVKKLDSVVLNDSQKKIFDENQVKIKKLNEEKDIILKENIELGMKLGVVMNEVDNLNNKIYKNHYNMICMDKDFVKYVTVEYKHIIIKNNYDRISQANHLLRDNTTLIRNAEVLRTLTKDINDDILKGLVNLNIKLLYERVELLKHYIHLLKKLSDIQRRKKMIKREIHNIRFDFKLMLAKEFTISETSKGCSKEYDILKKFAQLKINSFVK